MYKSYIILFCFPILPLRTHQLWQQ